MILKAEGISRNYFRNGKGTNYFQAVAPTDFELHSGKLTEIIGRSGSGKTTFINMIGGLLTPTEGRVLLDGEDIYALDDSRRSLIRNSSIGIIPQGQTGLGSLTVMENVLAPAAMYGDASSRKERAEELLELTGIADLGNVFSNELSGGELRRMAIARALINDPQMIIADEPTGDLDDDTTEMVLQLLKKCAQDGAAVLMVTHENAALKYADRIFRMEKGVLSEDGIS